VQRVDDHQDLQFSRSSFIAFQRGGEEALERAVSARGLKPLTLSSQAASSRR
jgi:hypothetical protein